MDRFSRTREHYCRQHQGGASHEDETPASPPTSPIFDFDFKQPRLDLTFDMENMAATDSRLQPNDPPDTHTTVAVSKGPASTERRRLIKRKPVPAATKTPCEAPIRDEVHTFVPPIPDDILVRFASRCDDGQKNQSCSISPKLWRSRFKDTITLSRKKASSTPAKDTGGEAKRAPSDKKVAPNFQEGRKVRDIKQIPSIGNGPAAGAEKQTETAVSQPDQTELLSDSLAAPHQKKFPIIRKMLSKLQF